MDEFLVYEYGPRGAKFIEGRNLKNFCDGPEICKNEHEARIHKIIPMLHYCQAVVCSAIGRHPATALYQAGIIPYETEGPLDKAVEEVACGRLQPPDWLLEATKARAGCSNQSQQ